MRSKDCGLREIDGYLRMTADNDYKFSHYGINITLPN